MKTNPPLVKIVQDMDNAIRVMQDAATWLAESGKKPSKWWQPKNMNREFLLRHAEPDEFFVALVDGDPAASVILQDSERNQSWKSVDGDRPQSALYVHWLCVARRFSGTGLPKVMVDFARDQARKQKLLVLRLDTNADETKLRKIYIALGFRLVGTQQEESQNTALYQKLV
ncbi:MAG: GNAT family N-acetyltransferase [Candidatus Gottesmanbacteria bacterium]|nr:GNAT family N-acetyltransferase [Candidatus Gottesmanbacteria bacterium]